jgi:DNA-binding transcriptional MerR regulator
MLLKTAEVCRILGGIHPRTLARLESRGLIGRVSGLLRHKLYARHDVEALVANLSSWKP